MIKITMEAPDDLFGTKALVNSGVKAVNDTVDDTLKDFNLTKATFDHQFSFVVKKATGVQGGKISGSVSTDNENYVRLNNGFVIKAVSGKLMSFNPVYLAKTTPGVIKAKGGSRTVGPKIVRMSRKGPTKVQARNFDVTIAEKHKQRFIQRVVTGR